MVFTESVSAPLGNFFFMEGLGRLMVVLSQDLNVDAFNMMLYTKLNQI